jgi:exo-beta-1,3-glucanase (GH17 family)
VRSPRPDRHWDFRLVALRVLSPAAAVVVLAAGGYGLSRIAGGSTSSVAAGSAAASAASSAQAGAAAVPSSAATSRPEAAPLVPAARFGVVTSATDYQRATLAQQLQHELQRYARPGGSVQELAPGPVKECVLRVTAGISPVSLVLVEKAYYQGQPANVIVAARGDHDAAWVTTPACAAGSDYVLDRTTLPGTSAS